jgi:putative tricarboxylic transport membrane protein
MTRDGVAGVVLLAGSLFLLWMARSLPHPPLVPVGPAFYPRILLTIIAVLSLALVVSAARALRRPSPAPTRYRLVLIAFAVFTGYVFLLPWLGYRLATGLFVGVMQAVLELPRGRGGWALLAVVALGTSLVTYYVFEAYLSVLLPRGRLTGF